MNIEWISRKFTNEVFAERFGTHRINIQNIATCIAMAHKYLNGCRPVMLEQISRGLIPLVVEFQDSLMVPNEELGQ